MSCRSNPPIEPADTFPLKSGRVVWYSAQRDQIWRDTDCRIHLYDFSTKEATELSGPHWQIDYPKKPQFHPDGQQVMFQGVQEFGSDIFTLLLDSVLATPVNITEGFPTRLGFGPGARDLNLDPRWTYDGTGVVFSQNGVIRLMSAGGGLVQTLLDTSAYLGEYYEPCLSPSGRYLYYTVKRLKSQDKVMRHDRERGTTCPISSVTSHGVVVRDYSTIFYYRKLGVSDDFNAKQWQVFMRVPNYLRVPDTYGRWPALLLPCNDCHSDNIHVAPVDETRIIFSGNQGGHGFKLFLGDIETGQRWLLPITQGADGRSHLGASYHP